LTGKRADTVLKLGNATIEVLSSVGYSELTVPLVAARAGLARATAYIYFSSKEHLVAEVYWRRLTTVSPPVNDLPDRADRVVAVLRHLALNVADEPEFAAAVTQALLSNDSDVEQLREQIGREIHHLLAAAVGTDGDYAMVGLLELIYTGAMVRAGMGHLSYDQVANQLEAAARQILA
jgi:AcrR family transcriptional regulator